MDTLAHALWAGVGAMALGRARDMSPMASTGFVALAVLPDVPHLVPMLTWVLGSDAPWTFVRDLLLATPGAEPVMPVGVQDLGRLLYHTMHSAVIAAAATAVLWIPLGAFRIVLLGWWSHIVIDVLTHSRDYYPVAVFYPFSNHVVDGIAWNARWALIVNYVFILAAYVALITTRRRPTGN